jgi:hypothetical protein
LVIIELYELLKIKYLLVKQIILKELDELKDNIVRKDRVYSVKSAKGGYLSDQCVRGSSWRSRPTLKTDNVVMSFDEIDV